ncbi:MAG: hypothetical protein IJV00_08275 [Clostridia bacterium]|nr:hypothetical protein [Clostridia bacterium]
MKTLKIIQTLMKIAKILCRIIFIFCIVGFCLCAAGIVSLALGVETLKIGDVTLHGLIENEAGIGMPELYAAIAVGMVFCVSEAVLCRFAENYFKNELADGTPFTLRGSKELLRLGILAVVIPLAALIVCSIGLGIAAHFYPAVEKIRLSDYSSVGTGVFMIILSLFCRSGAEQIGDKTETAG